MLVRPPAVAGMFYPAEKGELRAFVKEALAAAQVDPAPGRTRGVVAPHAGYRYSGLTAAHAFKRVEGARPARVMLVGRSHHHLFDGLSMWPGGALASPLGRSPVDVAFTSSLAHEFSAASPHAHDKEHALEVMLPFVQVLFGDTPVVAILFGIDPSPFAEKVGARLAELMQENDLLVLSTDFSHYLREPEANAIDARSIDAILEGDAHLFEKQAVRKEISLCGATAVEAGLACMRARGAGHRELLDYRTSAWASGDTERVVGYAAIAFEAGALA